MPETTDYMILGYAVTLVILSGLVVYLVLKARNLRAEMHTLETLEAEEKGTAKPAPMPAGKARDAISS